MVYHRVWDSSCPRVWDKWEADGATWVVQDLPPEHDVEAIDLLVEYLCTDEVLCAHTAEYLWLEYEVSPPFSFPWVSYKATKGCNGYLPVFSVTVSSAPASNVIPVVKCSYIGLSEDITSVRSIIEFWKHHVGQRMSLACYKENNGTSELVALNVCVVISRDDTDEEPVPIEGKPWQYVYGALKVADSKIDTFKYLEVDQYLYGLGLVVRRDFRGAKIGSRVLNARKPLSLAHGIRATSTVFTGPASQRSAEQAGFENVVTVTWKELAEAGLGFVPDETRCIKLMMKKFE